MKWQEIEALQEKFYEGETTLEEEKLLKEYFAQNEVPEQYNSVKDQFHYFSDEKKLDLSSPGLEGRILSQLESKNKREKQSPRLMMRIITAVAAGLLLIFTIDSVTDSISNVDPIDAGARFPIEACDDRPECFDETRDALLDISTQLKDAEKVESNETADHEEIK